VGAAGLSAADSPTMGRTPTRSARRRGVDLSREESRPFRTT
jgi:hypothetical protein